MLKKIYSHLVALCLLTLLFATPTRAQEKLWGIKNGKIFNVSTDGSEYSGVEIQSYGHVWINGIRVSPNNDLYFYAWNSIVKYNQESNSTEIVARIDRLEDFFIDHDGTIYGLTETGFVRIKDGETTILYDFGEWLDTLPTITDGNDGKVYICSGLTKMISINKDGTGLMQIADVHAENGNLLIIGDELFGMAYFTGVEGGLFKVKKDGSGFQVIAALDGSNWGFPKGSLLQGSDGLIYGVSSGNMIFRVNPTGDDFTVLDFIASDADCSISISCVQELIEWEGRLYGTRGLTELLSISLDGTEKQRYSFGELEAELSWFLGRLAVGKNGKIYLLAGSWYDNEFNGMFSITPTERKMLSSFHQGADPVAIARGHGSEVISIMKEGGTFGHGTVLKIDEENVVRVADLALDVEGADITDGGDGFIYGIGLSTPEQAGPALFRLSKSSGDFQSSLSPIPAFKRGKLLLHSNGAIYGTSDGGGNPRKGFVFKMPHDLSDLQNIHNGSDDGGKVPIARLIEASDGNLYGTMRTGGSANYGVVFKLDPVSYEYTLLWSFDGKTSKFPEGGLVQDSEGYLYGVTPEGGQFKKGVLFRIKTDGTDFVVIRNFDNTFPNPTGDLLIDKQEYIFGNYGGTSKNVFKIKNDGTELSFFLDSAQLFFAAERAPRQTYVVDPSDTQDEVPLDIVIEVSKQPLASIYTLQLSKVPSFFTVIHELQNDSARFAVSGLEPLTKYYVRAKTNLTPFGYISWFKTGEAPQTYPPKLWAIQKNKVVYMNLDGSGFEQSFQVGFEPEVNPTEISGSTTFIASTGESIHAYENQYTNGVFITIDGDGLQQRSFVSSEMGPASFVYSGNGFVYGVNRCRPECQTPTIFRMNKDGSNFTDRTVSIYGFNPLGGPIALTNHTVVGMSGGGGANNRGFIYSIRPDVSGIDILYSFSGPDGKSPTTSLMEGQDGWLYGVTTTGGANNYGAVFKIQANGSDYTKLHDFTSSKKLGANPVGNLVQDSGGTLYGICSGSGANKKGIIFRLNTDGTGYSTVHEFDGTTAANPAGNLRIWDDYIYGSAEGRIFRLRTNGADFSILRDGTGYANVFFFTSEPIQQNFALIKPSAEAGNYYSFFSAPIPQQNYATSYTLEISKQSDFSELAFSGTIPQLLHKMPFMEVAVSGLVHNSTYYVRARSSLLPYFGPAVTIKTLPPALRLYGLTVRGGPTSCGFGSLAGGSLFSIEPDGSNFVKHRDFPCWGGHLSHNIILGNDHALYSNTTGITSEGGSLFRMDLSGNFNVVGDLNFNPFTVMQASNGNFYLTQPDHFEEDPDFSVLHEVIPDPPGPVASNALYSFSNSEGYEVQGAPIELEDGFLYGLAASGGINNHGTFYRIKPDGSGFQVLHHFDGTHGSQPIRSLIEGGDGFLYGTTHVGGSFNSGTVFRVKADGTAHQVIHNFGPNQLLWSHGTILLIEDEIYGSTREIIYRVEKNGSSFTELVTFQDDDMMIVDGLVTDGEGILYGIRIPETEYGLGLIFKVATDGTGYEILHNFTDLTGGIAFGGLLLVDPQQSIVTEKQSSLARQATETTQDIENFANLSPNPFTNHFKVSLTDRHAPAHITITDVSGRIIDTGTSANGESEFVGEKLAVGVYIVKVVQNNRASIHRVIKK